MKTKKRSNKSLFTPGPLLLLLGAMLLLVFQPVLSFASISSRTWTGGGDNDNWSTADNWTGGVPDGTAGVTNQLTFSGTENRHTNVNDISSLTSASGGISARFLSANWHISGEGVRMPPNMGLTNDVADSVVVWDTPITNTANGTVFFRLGAGGSGFVLPNVLHSASTSRHFRKPHGSGGVGKISLLCPTNTFMGRIELGSGPSEFVSIANAGQPSSLGAWSAGSSSYSVYIGNSGTQYATDSSYIGTEDGQTDRVYYFGLRGPARFEFNNNSPNNSSLTFNGEWQFAPNTANNSLILGGTSLGTNTLNGRLYETGTPAATLDFGLDIEGPSTWVLNSSYELDGPLRFLSGTQYLGAAASLIGATGKSVSPRIVINPGAVLDVTALPAGLPIGPSLDQVLQAGRTADPDTDLVGDLNLQYYGTLDLGGIGTPATMKIAGNMYSKSGKGILYFDLSDQPAVANTNDLLEVSGNLDLAGGLTTINVNPYAGALLANTPYTLIKHGGSLLGTTANLNVPPPSRALNAVVSTVPGQVQVTFTPSGQSAANLLWAGAGYYWDVGASQSWMNGATPDYFQQLDSVTFNDTALVFDVNVAGVVVPGSILVDTEGAFQFIGSGSISGGPTTTLTKKGSGSLRIATANILSGPIVVSGGTLRSANKAALGTGVITLGDANTGAKNISLLLESATQVNDIVVSDQGTGAVIIGRDSGGAATFNGDIVLNRSLVLTNLGPFTAANRLWINSHITGVGNLTAAGGGYISLSQLETNSFVGNVTILDAGTVLQVDGGRGLPSTCNVEVGDGANLQPYGDLAINRLTGTGMVRGVQGTQTLTVGAANSNSLFAGKLVYNTQGSSPGIVNLRKAGTGTQILTGDSSTGPEGGSRGGTIVSEGILAVNNTEGSGLGSGAVLVEINGTLAGSGSIILTNSSATIQGKLSVGNAGDTAASSFTVTTDGATPGSLVFDGGTLEVDLFSGAGGGDNTANAAAADVLAVNGAAALNAGATLTVANPQGMTGWALGDKWKIINWASAPTGQFSSVNLPTLDSGKNWDLSALYSAGVVAVSGTAVQTFLNIERVNATTVKLTWPGSGILQSAPSVTGQFTDIEGAVSGYEATIGAGPVFYRLKLQ